MQISWKLLELSQFEIHKFIYFCQILGIFSHFTMTYLCWRVNEWMSEWVSEWVNDKDKDNDDWFMTYGMSLYFPRSDIYEIWNKKPDGHINEINHTECHQTEKIIHMVSSLLMFTERPTCHEIGQRRFNNNNKVELCVGHQSRYHSILTSNNL